MRLRIVLLLGALMAVAPGCVVHTMQTGAVANDGSVYLGWNLFSEHGRTDREEYPIGQQYGAFSSFRFTTDQAIDFQKVVVVFADGERYTAPIPDKLRAGQWSNPIALPRGPRQIHSIVIAAKSLRKGLAKVEIYANH